LPHLFKTIALMYAYEFVNIGKITLMYINVSQDHAQIYSSNLIIIKL